MKLKNLILAAIVCSIGFTQCKKDDNNNSSLFSGSKVSGMTSYYNGKFESSQSFQYDASGRISKVISDDGSYSIVEYSASKVKVLEFDKQVVIQDTITYVLNSKGLAISANYSSSTKKRASISSNHLFKMAIAAANTSAEQVTYEYDANGYRIKEVSVNGLAGYTTTYEISGGNTISSSEKYVNSTYTFTYTTTYQFITDKKNSIGFENVGLSFFGKQDANLRSSETVTNSGTSSQTTNYTYEYDSKNRVVKQTIVSGTGTNNSYITYTYTD